MTSAEEPDTDLATAVGVTRLAAGARCVDLGIITAMKRARAQIEQGRPSTASARERVEGCSWWYVAASFLIPESFTVLKIFFAFAAQMCTPPVAVCRRGRRNGHAHPRMVRGPLAKGQVERSGDAREAFPGRRRCRDNHFRHGLATTPMNLPKPKIVLFQNGSWRH